VDKF
jgi:hypothetical protein